MKYQRPQYLDPTVETQTVRAPYGPDTAIAPRLDTPITPRENFRRSIDRKDPLWMPNSLTDKITIGANDVALHKVRGMQIHSDFLVKPTANFTFKDWFNTDWTWIVEAGGPMLTPGTQLMDDITKWEKQVVFPDLTEWGFEEKAKEFMKNEYDSSKTVSYDIGRGMTERLVSLMGGYTDAMEVLLTEPEAVTDFFNEYSAFLIRVFDVLNNLYPLDIITLHDDWGTERDTFFSEKVMEELVYTPTKRFIDHVHSKGVYLEMHTCGNVTRFFPYMADLNCDIAQVQRRAVDMPKMKKRFGDKIGFCAWLEDIDPSKAAVNDEYIAAVQRTVDIYAPGGGSYLMMFTPNEQVLWNACVENYFYSKEIYSTLIARNANKKQDNYKRLR